MEIHHPESPIHSFKAFAVHIGIVTLGILIALGLEGIRESIHEHHLLAETRENFRAEIVEDQKNIQRELENDNETAATIQQILADLPVLQRNPAALKSRVAAIQPSLYFLSSSSWTSALSSGALAHMSTEEVDRYASFNLIVQSYVTLESQSLPMNIDLQSYVQSRKSFTPVELDQTEQKLRNFQMYVHVMAHVAQQCAGVLQDAIPQKV